MDLKRPLLAGLCALLIGTVVPTPVQARLIPKKPYKVLWREEHGRIDTASVCANFSRATLDYRQCRSYAVDVFKRKCRKYTRRYEQAGSATRQTERRMKRKFCSAYRRFSP